MRRPHRWTGTALAAAVLSLAAATPAGATTTRTPQPSIAVTLAPGLVSPATIVGGDGAVQTVRLSRPAPAGGIDVWITAGDVVYTTTAGSSVHVPAGATSVTVAFRLSAPPATVVRSLWAQVSGAPLTKVAEVTVLAADPSARAVAGLRFRPDTVVVGGTTTGTVTLRHPAPPGGVAVSLWSNTSYGPNVSVPPFVLVEAGRTSVTFPATVFTADEPAVVWPSADLGTSRATAPLVVVPASFALGSAVVRPGTQGELAVGIGAAAGPAGATVRLSSDTPGVTVPAAVTIPAGSSGAAVPVRVADSVPPGGTARITATWNGASVTNTVYLG